MIVYFVERTFSVEPTPLNSLIVFSIVRHARSIQRQEIPFVAVFLAIMDQIVELMLMNVKVIPIHVLVLMPPRLFALITSPHNDTNVNANLDSKHSFPKITALFKILSPFNGGPLVVLMQMLILSQRCLILPMRSSPTLMQPP
jgi:hypothetical protein